MNLPRPSSGTSSMLAASEYVEVVIEVPRGSFVKRRPDGSVDIVGPMPCPFNYGSVPSIPAPDGDPLDAVILGDHLPYGHVGRWRVRGMLKFTDAGQVDNKLVCVQERSVEEWCPLIGSTLNALETVQNLGGHSTSEIGIPKNRSGCGSAFSRDFGASTMSNDGSSSFRQKWTRGSTPKACAKGCEGERDLRERKSSTHYFSSEGGPSDIMHYCKKALQRQPSAKVDRRTYTSTNNGVRNSLGSTTVCTEMTLGEYIMLTGFFRSYAVFKRALNLARGKCGRTAFEGWEFP